MLWRSTRATINGVTTRCALDVEYDVATGKMDYYYQADGQRVALRKALGLHYLLNDHLGSTSVLLKTNGALWGEQRYSAWGQTRYTYGNLSADRQFTGQITRCNYTQMIAPGVMEKNHQL